MPDERWFKQCDDALPLPGLLDGHYIPGDLRPDGEARLAPVRAPTQTACSAVSAPCPACLRQIRLTRVGTFPSNPTEATPPSSRRLAPKRGPVSASGDLRRTLIGKQILEGELALGRPPGGAGCARIHRGILARDRGLEGAGLPVHWSGTPRWVPVMCVTYKWIRAPDGVFSFSAHRGRVA